MALFKKTGGLKISVTRKGNQAYFAIACAFGLVLIAGAGYSIWYSVRVVESLFVPSYGTESHITSFNLDAASSQLKLQDSYWELQQIASSTPSVIPSVTR